MATHGEDRSPSGASGTQDEDLLETLGSTHLRERISQADDVCVVAHQGRPIGRSENGVHGPCRLRPSATRRSSPS